MYSVRTKILFSTKTLLTPFLSGEKIASIKDAKSTADAVCDACEVDQGTEVRQQKNKLLVIGNLDFGIGF